MMKRTLLSFMLAIGMVANIWADTVIEGIKYALNDDFTATVTGLDDPSFTGTITIPETIKSYGNTYQVVQIGDKAFFEYKFKSVVIPNSVTSIGDSAFCKCTGLTSIDIPNSVTSIGNYAFRECTGLTSIDIPNSVTSIGSYAFADCTGLTSIDIPNSVTSIGTSPFADCTGLTAINVDENNTAYSSIDGVLFNKSQTELVQYPEGKQGAYTIPNSVTSIGVGAFRGCRGLTSVSIPNSVTSIGEYAFGGCIGLTSVTINNNEIMSKTYSYSSNFSTIFGNQVQTYIIGDSVTSIGFDAFGSCTSLIAINVDENNTNYSSIDGVLFNKSQTELIRYPRRKQGAYTVPNSVENIEKGAFSGCTGLTSVTIGNSVTSIGNGAFDYCTGLTSVTIPNSVTSIGENTFYNCTSLTSVTIPNSVTSIGALAFYLCTGLTSIDIPNSVTSIGTSAFVSCLGLTSIDIPNSVTSIGYEAFWGCTGLTNIYCHIDDPITIDSYVFYYVPKNTCTLHVPIGSGDVYRNADGWKDFLNIVEDLPTPSSFTIGNLKYTIMSNSTVRVSKDGTLTGELVIPESVEYEGKQYSVTRISFGAFADCTGLTSVTIPNSVTSTGDAAFRNCTGLTSVTINSNAIMSKTYSSSSNFSTIFGNQVQTYTIGNSVTSIGSRAFYRCTGLTSIDIPNSVTSIGNYAFVSCLGLTSIDIPNSVTSIGYGAFRGCTSLTSIDIPNSVTSIGGSALSGCTSLTDIYCHIEEPLEIVYSVFENVSTNTCTLHVPIGSKEKYEAANYWNEFLNIVEFDVTSIVSIDNSQLTIENDVWHTLNGVRLNGKPTKAGIYIVNGKKVVVK